MKFTTEQIRTAKQAKTAEELMELAKENGIELTEEEARSLFSRCHRTGALSDEELNNVSGGCGSSTPPNPRYQNGQHLWVGYFTTQNYLEVVVDAPEFYDKDGGWRYLVTLPEYGYQQNFFLETRSYVHTTDPGSKWID